MVDTFFKDRGLAEKLLESLKQIADLERLISKVAVNRINPREMLQLKRSLRCIQPIKQALAAHESSELKKTGGSIAPLRISR